jgi:hypothetical protein
MKNFDFEAGKRFRKEGEIVEALRCFRSALDEDKDSVETYLELAVTYVLAFEDSGDPLCLDSARKVCLAGLRREPTEAQRRRLIEIQDKVEDLILESEKAEVDAMSDAMGGGAEASPEAARIPHDPSGLSPDMLEEDEEVEDPGKDRGH